MASEISCFLALAFYQVCAVFLRHLHLAYPTARGLFLIQNSAYVLLQLHDSLATTSPKLFLILSKVTTGIYTNTHTHPIPV
jgi:hypothetical protein